MWRACGVCSVWRVWCVACVVCGVCGVHLSVACMAMQLVHLVHPLFLGITFYPLFLRAVLESGCVAVLGCSIGCVAVERAVWLSRVAIVAVLGGCVAVLEGC